MIRRRLAIGLLLGLSSWGNAEALALSVKVLETKHAVSFPPQLWVQVTNEGFTSVPLADKIQASVLLVDGARHQRLETPFKGPAGLPLKTSWEGCLTLEAYLPSGLAPGTHRLQLQIGDALSKPIRMRIEKEAAKAEDAAARLRQGAALQEALQPGLIRSCVENWLHDVDGGLQNPDTVRYYLDPDVKILVPYEESTPEPRVKGRIRIYQENRILD